MNILWFTWKDLRHPLAGGVERVNEELVFLKQKIFLKILISI